MLLAEAPGQRLRERSIAELDGAYPRLWEHLQELCEGDLVEYVRGERAYYLAPEGFDAAEEVYWMRRREAEATITAADLAAIEAHNLRVRRRNRRGRRIQHTLMASAGVIAVAVTASLLFSVEIVRRTVPAAGATAAEQATMDSVLQVFVDSLERR